MAFADELNVAGIVGLHGTVAQAGDLPGAASFVILDSTHNADLIAHGEDLQTLTVQVVAIVNSHAVVDIVFAVVIFHVDSLAVLTGDNAVESDLHTIVLFNVVSQFAEGQLHCITIVELGVRLTGEHIELIGLCLVDGSHAGLAVAAGAGIVGDGQTVLQDLQVQVAVGIAVSGLIPNPDQVAVAGRVCIPGRSLRFNDDRGSLSQGILGEAGSCFAIFLDLAGGLRSVDGQETALQHAGGHDRMRNIEMHGISVNIGLDGDFLLGGVSGHIQHFLAGIIDPLGLLRQSFLGLRRLVGGCRLGGLNLGLGRSRGRLVLLAAAKAAKHQTQNQKQGKKLFGILHRITKKN